MKWQRTVSDVMARTMPIGMNHKPMIKKTGEVVFAMMIGCQAGKRCCLNALSKQFHSIERTNAREEKNSICSYRLVWDSSVVLDLLQFQFEAENWTLKPFNRLNIQFNILRLCTSIDNLIQSMADEDLIEAQMSKVKEKKTLQIFFDKTFIGIGEKQLEEMK